MRLILLSVLMINGIAYAQVGEFDPMMPPWLKKKITDIKIEKKVNIVSEKFNLRQVVINEAGKSAVINGYVLREGQHIHQAKVISIKPDEVVLVRDDMKWILNLTDSAPNVRR
ncbi:hypothetical protein NBRC116188_14610 [Oceaniserpentilla sp. 4NH20-0058]|uniref:hypothetical protein n=1 Tax=Oceaniserpentilla sp. 4NH20-0058 TaxID=3127660 RepID=UPI0031059753